ncbi:unnamed protein product [marine sediment metagenome]|uniref:Uncharacterized protein n=1 Tax=marine sediment metagenome TaxID=412755 RepID=X1DBF2_9ZZZZ
MEAHGERGPGGDADGTIIEVREPEPLGRQAVEMGRVDLAAIAAQIRITQVVAEDQHDIRPWRIVAGRQRAEAWEQDDERRNEGLGVTGII